jgi:TctA family transporter
LPPDLRGSKDVLRRAMILGRGDPMLFLTRPISLAFVLGTAAKRTD